MPTADTFYFSKPISASALECIVNRGTGAASKYWADKFEVKLDTKRKKNLDLGWAIVNGYTVGIHDAESNKWEDLDINKLLTGLEKVDYCIVDYNEVSHMDADKILQVSIFGKEVYA